MSKCYKPHKQHKYRKLAQAGEMKERMIERWAPTLKARMAVTRYTAAEISARFVAAQIDMISGTCKDNLGHEVLPGERDALKGLQFQGLIEPEAWEEWAGASDHVAKERAMGEMIPATCDTFSVSLPELRRGEMLLVFSNDSGELSALAYK